MKKNTYLCYCLIAVLISTLFMGCDLGEVGSTDVAFSVIYKGEKYAEKISTVTFTPYFELLEAKIGLEGIDINILGESDQEKNVETNKMFPGPYSIDLFDSNSSKEIGHVNLVNGTYESVEMNFSKQVYNNADSIYLRGSYHDASDHVTGVFFHYSGTNLFEVNNTDGFKIDSKNNSVILTFDMDSFFNDINLGDRVPGGTTPILIDLNNNVDWYSTIYNNIKNSCQIGLDSNDDGIVDSLNK